MLISYSFIILCAQSALAGVLLSIVSGWVFPFTTDSMIHISTAQHIAQFQGLVFSNFFIYPPMLDLIPAQLAPPGYPISIAFFKWMGVNEYAAALILPRACYLLLPFLFFNVFKKFFAVNLALVVTALCTFTFAVIGCAVISWTDVPYLALTLTVIKLVLDRIEDLETVRPASFLYIGLLSGAAFLLRYVGLSLIVSVLTCLLAAVFIRGIMIKGVIKNGFWYLLGAGMLIVPYCVRNVIVLGGVSYHTAPVSVQQFAANFIIVTKLFWNGLSLAVFGVSWMSWLLLIVAGVLIFWFIQSICGRVVKEPKKFLAVLMLAAYVLGYSVFVIVNKSQNFIIKNPDIDQRLMIQIAWIFIAGCVYVLVVCTQVLRRTIAILLSAAFILFQLLSAGVYYDHNDQIRDLSTRLKKYFPLNVPGDQVIVSNVSEMVYYYANRNVRGIDESETPYSLLVRLGAYRKFVVVLVKGVGHLSPAWRYDKGWEMPGGYAKIYSDDLIDVLVPLMYPKLIGQSGS